MRRTAGNPACIYQLLLTQLRCRDKEEREFRVGAIPGSACPACQAGTRFPADDVHLY
ncbi:hypothetical cytosolic protein [Syntrophus aciditrophicus SB]|uniref:Hypothetical cytosolic protein n=1 Tax=Syntrophus aciditrophicus (strain SB) TaxID=56780 RepID=Q2LQP6_SYNAS|nr:hypothetical cytosolic protein [Syntrophus aciditrophicus SB]